MLKNKIWIRKNTIAEVTIIQRNQMVEETTLLEEIQRNNIKEQEDLKKLKKGEGIICKFIHLEITSSQ